jgi:hypothetical protein
MRQREEPEEDPFLRASPLLSPPLAVQPTIATTQGRKIHHRPEGGVYFVLYVFVLYFVFVLYLYVLAPATRDP